MRHLLMDPAFPDIVGQIALDQIDDQARVWIVERGSDGGLAERLDPSFLAKSATAEVMDEVVEALIIEAAEQDVAATRIW